MPAPVATLRRTDEQAAQPQNCASPWPYTFAPAPHLAPQETKVVSVAATAVSHIVGKGKGLIKAAEDKLAVLPKCLTKCCQTCGSGASSPEPAGVPAACACFLNAPAGCLLPSAGRASIRPPHPANTASPTPPPPILPRHHRSKTNLVCIAPKVTTLHVEPSVTCPPGCDSPAGGKCLCDAGGPAPCPPGTRDCGILGQR